MSGAFDGLPRDYREMLALLRANGADFIIVGGWAMAAHGHPRATKDLDVFVRPTPENAPRVYRALAQFGAPLGGISVADFATPGVILQIGVGLRVDITTTIEGVSFDEAAHDCISVEMDGDAIPVIGRAALVRNKRASGRVQDRADVLVLQRLAGKAGRSRRKPPR